ncbi:MAG TPA: alpha/beta fold hydrolase [Baekduia sp.]|uniref:esterase/lipase family protein n=1 Tax=Baekduia sp. TaxID=2600305 RepID=UPI002CBEAAFD|nr:alpha/beta fold hydrolase [Baekduia sp.]HMJ32767.1 alpha/beta fold hydrolase [Baekduia sp.]
MRIKRLAAALAVASSCLAGSAASAGAALPVVYNFPTAIAASALQPGGSPLGANDWSCRPSAAHPRPVVLVNGTFANQITSWNAFSPLLKNDGYCVYTFNYGGMFLGQIGAYGSIAASADELKTEVTKVLASTGAAKVDIVGWSQGGMMPRYYIKNLGGASKVNHLVGLAPSNHGTTLSGLATLAGYFPGALPLVGALCPACTDQVKGSPFITALNTGGDTVPGVRYTVIQSKYDEVVTPYTSAFLSGSNVTNITIQDKCFLDLGEHLSMTSDHIVGRAMLNALDPATARSTICSPIVPAVGG